MNISSRCEYGFRAIIELAHRAETHEPVTVDVIAERRDIPEKFLIHILLQLKRAGIVKSIRGARGGYMLARPPAEISALDIVRAIDGPVLSPLPVKGSGSLDLAPTWKEIARGIEEVLRGTNVQAILNRAEKSGMYYI